MDAALGRQPDPAFVEAELTRLLDHAPHGWTAEPLAHNLHNAVTAGIWRVRSDGLTAVLKVLSGAQTDDGRWVGSSDPRDWNYWEREALAYESGLAQRWERFGLRAPRLLESFRRSDGTIALWLEHVDGSTGAGWTIDGLETMVVGLGTAQGELTRGATDELPWTSRRFLRSYVGSKHLGWDLFENDDAWAQPLIRDNFPPGLREQMARLHADRDWFLRVLEELPRTVCHLDVWPANLIDRGPGDTVLVDWSFVGDGCLGEDLGNLIPDCVADLFVPSDLLPELTRRLYDGYTRGLSSAGWRGDERLIRLGMLASAVKYDWLAAHMLDRAVRGGLSAYGGSTPTDPAPLFRARGAALAHLAGWAEEARRLAPSIGWPAP